MRYFAANVGLFVAFTGIAMVGDYLDVRARFHPSVLLDYAIRPLLILVMWSVIPVSCWMNWHFLDKQEPRKRLILGIGLGLLFCVLAFIPYVLIILKFHTSIGGTL